MTGRGITAAAVALLGAVAACASFGASSDTTTPVSDAGAQAEGGPGSAEAGPAVGCAPNAELCESFESGAIDPRTWQQKTNNGSLSLADDDADPLTGTTPNHVLRVTRTAEDGRADVYLVHPVRLADHPLPFSLATRAWVKLANPIGAGVYALTYGAVDGTSLLQSALADHDTKNWVAQHEIGGGTEASAVAAMPVPVQAGQWVCLELVVTYGAVGHITLWVNGKNPIHTQVDTYPGNAPDQILIEPGLIESAGASVQSVDVDDVVSVVVPGLTPPANPPIGCGQ